MSVIGEFIRANKPKTTKRCLESNGTLVQYGVVVGIVGVMLMIGSSNLPLLVFFSYFLTHNFGYSKGHLCGQRNGNRNKYTKFRTRLYSETNQKQINNFSKLVCVAK